jgi:hypothetical protein
MHDANAWMPHTWRNLGQERYMPHRDLVSYEIRTTRHTAKEGTTCHANMLKAKNKLRSLWIVKVEIANPGVQRCFGVESIPGTG